MEETLKIGVLYLQSNQFTNIGADFLNGIKLESLPVKFIVESIGIGSNENVIIDKLQKLSLQDDIKTFIAFTGHKNIELVYRFAEDNGLTLIACDLGATLPYGMRKYKGVYINSYALNESVYLLGKYLSRNGFQNISSSSSYYDAGYGLLSALEHAVSNTASAFAGHYITPFQPRVNEAECMEQSITSCKPDAVVAFHSGLYATEHAGFITQTSLPGKKIPYYATPFTYTENMLTESLAGNLFITGSWLEHTGEDCAFMQMYIKKNGKRPSVFSMLGYEAFLLLNAILKGNAEGYTEDEVIAALKAVNGPRGLLKIDFDTNRTFFNHYIYKISAYDQNNFFFEKMETLENNGEFIKNILSIAEPQSIGGWHNAYLCH